MYGQGVLVGFVLFVLVNAYAYHLWIYTIYIHTIYTTIHTTIYTTITIYMLLLVQGYDVGDVYDVEDG